MWILIYSLIKKCDLKYIDEIRNIITALGCGIGEDFDEEKKGLVPDTKWKKNALGKPWLLGETLISGIGQGYKIGRAHV